MSPGVGIAKQSRIDQAGPIGAENGEERHPRVTNARIQRLVNQRRGQQCVRRRWEKRAGRIVAITVSVGNVVARNIGSALRVNSHCADRTRVRQGRQIGGIDEALPIRTELG